FVSPTSLVTSETGTSATFDVRLTSKPLAAVAIDLSGVDPTQGKLSDNKLIFNPSNWNVNQTVTVTGLDDGIVHGDQSYQITGKAKSGDRVYHDMSMSPVTVVNLEADVAGFVVKPTSLTTSEAGTSAQFDVRLTSQPRGQVVLTLVVSDPSQGTLSQNTLTFDASNWRLAQSVTVTGLHDNIVHGDQMYQITGRATSTDTVYQGKTMRPVTVT